MKVKRIFKSVMALTLAFLMVFTIPCISMADPITDSSMLPVEEIANGDASDDDDYYFDYDNGIATFTYDGTSVYDFYASSVALDEDEYCSYENSSFAIYDYDDLDPDVHDFDDAIPVYEKYVEPDGHLSFQLDSTNLENGKKYMVQLFVGYNCSLSYSIDRYIGYSTAITIDEAVSVEVNDMACQYVRNVVPANSYSKITWESNDPSIATVDEYGGIYGKKEGTCTVTATLSNGKTYSCAVTVNNPAPYLKKKSYYLPKDSTFTNQLLYSTDDVTWYSTNKKVATVSSTGKVKGVGFGTCYIKAKSGGKTYSCKVNVYRLKPDYIAYIENYDTRNNRFQVRFENNGKRNLYVYSKNAEALDCDYTYYDRSLRLSRGTSYVVIKPGKSKLVNFYVNGSITWFDEDDFTIVYYMKYHGKKYLANADSDYSESYYKRSNGWYYTYKDLY